MPYVGCILGHMAITASEMGKRGMRSRLSKMTPEQRKAMASHAAKARWGRISKEQRSEIMRARAAKRKPYRKKHKLKAA